MKLSIKATVVMYRYIHIMCILLLCYWYKTYYPYFFLSILGYIVLFRIGGDLGFHRLFCHKSFTTTKGTHLFLLLLGSLANLGSSITWNGSHEAHHRNSDKEGDPHSPSRIGVFNVIFLNWDQFKFPISSIKSVKHYSTHLFIHNHYFSFLTIGYLILLLILGFELFVYAISIPVIYGFIVAGLQNSIGHMFGYTSHNTLDNSRNNLIIHILSFGNGMHNNHHADPKSYNQSGEKWYEFDWGAIFIKLFLAK